jgi:hypothetical protein
VSAQQVKVRIANKKVNDLIVLIPLWSYLLASRSSNTLFASSGTRLSYSIDP